MKFVETAQAKNLNDAESALGDVVGSSGIDQSDLGIAAGTVVEGILGAVGLIFFGLMVYAGMKWMLARGEEEKVTKARDTIIAASIGLVIIVAAYAITNLVVDRIVLKTGVDGYNAPGEEAKNVIGSGSLGCCIMPVDYYSLGSAIPSVTTEDGCNIKAFDMMGFGDGNKKEITQEEIATTMDKKGSTWNFYSEEKAGTTNACIGIAKCWVAEPGVSNENECIKKLLYGI